jgi:hypothetical protein
MAAAGTFYYFSSPAKPPGQKESVVLADFVNRTAALGSTTWGSGSVKISVAIRY